MTANDRLDPRLAARLRPADADLLARWCVNNRRRLRVPAVPERLSGGTRAWLEAVYLEEDTGTVHKCLVKYCPTRSYSSTEPGAHIDAHATSPERFARDHLVRQLWDPVGFDDGGSLMFLEIVNNGLSRVTTAAALFGTSEMVSALRTVSRSVLADWNPRPRLEHISAPDLTKALLGERLHPGRGLRTWIETNADLRRQDWLRSAYHREPLANPLALLDGRLGEDTMIGTHIGNAHGDLHLDNILVPRHATTADPRRFRLVDLSAFQADAPLARDVMSLLVATVALHLPELGPQTRWAAISLMVDTQARDVSMLSQQLRDSILAIWQAGHQWASPRGLADEWRGESLVSLACAALAHVPRRSDPADAVWFFLLAACATSALLPAGRHDDAAGAPHVVDLLMSDQRTSTLTQAPALPGDARPARRAMAELTPVVDAIVAVAELHRPATWRRVLRRLPATLVGSPKPSGRLRVQVASLLRRFASYRGDNPWGLLLEALRRELPSTAAVDAVELAIDHLGLRLSSRR